MNLRKVTDLKLTLDKDENGDIHADSQKYFGWIEDIFLSSTQRRRD
jgi:hypothetical protein